MLLAFVGLAAVVQSHDMWIVCWLVSVAAFALVACGTIWCHVLIGSVYKGLGDCWPAK